MRNPVVGLWMQGAALANMVVRSITLDDRYRNYTKEQRDRLEEAKKNLDEREISRKLEGVRMAWDIAKAQESRFRALGIKPSGEQAEPQ